MAKADFIRPVEALHGKLKKSDKVGFAKRTKSGTKFTVTRDSWKRTFRDAAAAQEAARAIDPTKMDDDAVAFRNQSKYTTMHGFLFAEEWKNYQG